MMMEIHNTNIVPIYEDEYMEENTIIKGEHNGIIYLIVNPKKYNIVYKTYLHKLRKEKLKKINKKCQCDAYDLLS